MKRIIIVLTMMFATASVISSQTKSDTNDKQSGKVEQAIMQMEREWVDAFVKRDAATLERILASDFTDTDDEGHIENDRAKYIDFAKNSVGTFTSIELSETKVRVYGNSAVSTGRYVIKGSEREQGEPFRYMAVYVKRQGRWQAVAFQSTRITAR